MNKVLIKQRTDYGEPKLGSVYIREDFQEIHVVMIVGNESVSIIDLTDGVAWFSYEFETPKEADEALIADGFKRLPIGNSVEVIVN